MSENAKIPVSPEAKGKLKKILPVVAIVVVLVVIITSCFGGGGSAKSVNKEACKNLLKQNPKKILSMMPKGYEDNVMNYYDDYVKNRKELKEGIKQQIAKEFDDLGKVKKIKYKESFEVDLNSLSGLTLSEAGKVKGMYNGIKAMWEDISECNEGYATIAEITYKKDGEKTTEEYILCSFKYKGKWYSMNAMSTVYQGAWGYTPNKRG